MFPAKAEAACLGFIAGTLSLWALVCQGAPLTWFPLSPLSSARSAAAVVHANGAILILGGNPPSAGALALGGSNPPPLDTARVAPGAITLPNGLVAVYGGRDGTDGVLGSVISYDPQTGDVLDLAPMSTPRYELAYAPDAHGRAYAIGGLNDHQQALASVERYDPVTNGWSTVASLPGPRYQFPAVFDGTNRLYTFGGRTNATAGAETTAVLCFNIGAGTWATVASMPVPTAGSAAVLGPDGKIYVLGGTSGGVVTNLVQVYDPIADSWMTATLLPSPISAAMAAVDASGHLVVMGGVDTNDADLAAVWVSQQLNAPDAAPVFTQFPAASATYQVPYNSVIQAQGNPQPTYSLVSGPVGMQVDAYSGSITWTPQANQMGTNPVAIRATNVVGSTDWNFSITATGPPPTAPAGLALVTNSDTSATLSWSPSAAVVGTLAYDLYERHVIYQPKGGSRAYFTLLIGGIGGTSVTINGLAVGSTHTYAVAAYAAGAESGLSPPLAVTTTSPQPPANFHVTGLTSTTVSLAWDPSPGPAQNPDYSVVTSYSVLERFVSVSPPVNLPRIVGLTTTNATVTGLLAGSSNLWVVQAFDMAGTGSLTYPIILVTNPTPVSVSLGAPSEGANGGFQLNARGAADQTAQVWATTNLSDPASWAIIGSFMPADAAFSFTDTNASEFSARFYRVLQP